jgi:Fe-S cluster biogenesis protein NfuA
VPESLKVFCRFADVTIKRRIRKQVREDVGTRKDVSTRRKHAVYVRENETEINT